MEVFHGKSVIFEKPVFYTNESSIYDEEFQCPEPKIGLKPQVPMLVL